MTATVLSPPPPVRTAPAPTKLWGALLTVYLVWGSTYLAIRVVADTMPGMLSASARYGTAAALLGGFLVLRRGRGALRVTRPQLMSSALVGILLLCGGNGVVVLGEKTVPSGLAALLVASVPLWVVVLRTGLADLPRPATIGGVLLGFAGLLVLVLPGGSAGGATMFGVLLILGAALSWATGSVLSGRLSERGRLPADAFVTTVWEMAAGSVACLLVGLARGETGELQPAEFSTEAWIALGYLITFGSIFAFSAYAWLLQNAPISLVATYAYVNPVVAVALGALILGEAVTLPILLGGGIVVAGVGLVVSTERRAS